LAYYPAHPAGPSAAADRTGLLASPSAGHWRLPLLVYLADVKES
jgi:hypothetical protein